MKKAIIYGRVSTTKQSVESIETQISECKKWAENNDCVIVDIYDDSGQSGRAYNVGNRAGFHQIKDDARNGRMDFALIYRIDRFARSVADYFIQERELEKYDVQIIVVGMPFFQTADIITKSVHIAVAEQFSKNLSEDVYLKMRTFAAKGSFLGGKPPYGFDVVVNEEGNKTLAINEEQAAGVRLIYETYLNGYGYTQVSRIIAEHGFLNELGNPFTPTHIMKVLKSEKYNGSYVFGRRETHKGKERMNRDKSSIIVLPDVYPKIIEDEMFAAVQARMKTNIVKNKTRIRQYPFTGLITCGSCGRAVTGTCTVKKDRNKTYSYYKCTGYRVNGCRVASVSADYLEAFVSRVIKNHVFDDKFTSRLIKEVESNLSTGVSSFRNVKDKLENELIDKKEQIKEAMKDKYSKNKNQNIYDELIDEWNDEMNAIELKLAHINEQLNIEDKTNEIKSYIAWLRNNLESADAEIKNQVLRQCVHSIIVTDEQIEIFLYLSAESKSGTRQYLGSANIDRGVPTLMIDEQEVYTNNGTNLIKVATGSIEEFNKTGK